MNNPRKIFLAFAAAVVAPSFLVVNVVDAAAFMEVIVKCLPEDPDVCIGELFTATPSPAIMCKDPDTLATCETMYMGGYSWTYDFVEGLQEGTDDFDAIEAAKTGLSITIDVDDDATCKVLIGDETCSVCSTEGCNSDSSIKYDCTNIDNGGESFDECASMDDEPFIYPLRLASEEALESLDSPAADDLVRSGESSSATKSSPRVVLGTEMLLSLLFFGILCLN